jgi:hypothetical protein
MTNINKSLSEEWTYFVINNIKNPSFYSKNENFTIKSLTIDNQLTSKFEGALDISIKPPCSNIHMIGFNVSDHDLLYLSTHNITYRFDSNLFTNATSFVIKAPNP